MKIQNRKLDVIDTLCIVMIIVMGLLFVFAKDAQGSETGFRNRFYEVKR
jgi:hypothetical protein